MLPLAVGLAAFLVAYAAWRCLLGSRNWAEGCAVSLIVAILACLLTRPCSAS
jgi:hypothetical protein